MPYVKIWIHCVWSTKNREPFLTDNMRPKLFRHIRANAAGKGIHIDFIGGYVDHVHCLVSLGSEQKLGEIIQLIKGESSHWINQNALCRERFAWQSDYFAVSVSDPAIDSVRDYIRRQEEHHKKKSFDAEFENFLRKAGFQSFSERG